MNNNILISFNGVGLSGKSVCINYFRKHIFTEDIIFYDGVSHRESFQNAFSKVDNTIFLYEGYISSTNTQDKININSSLFDVGLHFYCSIENTTELRQRCILRGETTNYMLSSLNSLSKSIKFYEDLVDKKYLVKIDFDRNIEIVIQDVQQVIMNTYRNELIQLKRHIKLPILPVIDEFFKGLETPTDK